MKGKRLAGLAASLIFASALLGVLDQWLGAEASRGLTQRQIDGLAAQSDIKPDARILVLGSSTSGWLRPSYLARTLELRANDVLDAHMNACLQDCSWAQVRRFSRERRRFELAFVGINLYAMCEKPDVNRITQLSRLTEPGDLLDVVALLARSENPVRAWVRLMGVEILQAYRDPRQLRHAIRALLGAPVVPQTRLWMRQKGESQEAPRPTCRYEPDEVAFKQYLTTRLLEDLATISDRRLILLLPDRSSASEELEVARIWARHRKFLEALAERVPGTQLIDLARDGAPSPGLFVDAVHLRGAGTRVQRALFERKLEALDLR